MTPDGWISFAREFGLPLVMLAIFAVALYRRWFVTGKEADAWKALYEREREDRIAAQKSMGDLASENANVAEQVAKLSERVVNPYDERIRGTRARG